jgi:hypothetical protein
MLVHRNSPFRLRSSSRPVTTWRTPATMPSISRYPRAGGRQRTHAQRMSQGNGATAKHNTIETTCQQRKTAGSNLLGIYLVHRYLQLLNAESKLRCKCFINLSRPILEKSLRKGEKSTVPRIHQCLVSPARSARGLWERHRWVRYPYGVVRHRRLQCPQTWRRRRSLLPPRARASSRCITPRHHPRRLRSQPWSTRRPIQGRKVSARQAPLRSRSAEWCRPRTRRSLGARWGGSPWQKRHLLTPARDMHLFSLRVRRAGSDREFERPLLRAYEK